MGDQPLRGNVVLVESEMIGADVERAHGLTRREPLELRDAHLDHEAATRLEVRRDVLEAGDLLVLRGQVVDRVEDEVGDGERTLDGGRREITDRDADRIAARPGAQPRHHRVGEVDALDRDTPLGERQRDAARADAQLERRAVSGQVGEEFDGRVDDRRVEHVGGRLVVSIGHSLAKVVLGHRLHSVRRTNRRRERRVSSSRARPTPLRARPPPADRRLAPGRT